MAIMWAASMADTTPVLEPLLPGLFKQGSGTGLVAGGVEGATALQQDAQAGPRGGLGEAGSISSSSWCACANWRCRNGAGYLGEQFQFALQAGCARLGQQGMKTQGAGGGILVIPLRHEIGRTVHLASLPVILTKMPAGHCLYKGRRHRAPLESCPYGWSQVDHGQAHQHQAEGGEGPSLMARRGTSALGRAGNRLSEAQPRHQPVEGRVARGGIGRPVDDDEQDEEGERGQDKPAGVAGGDRPQREMR